MARKKYTVVPGTAATKVIDLSPAPAKTEKPKKVVPVVEETEAAEAAPVADEAAPVDEAPTETGF